MGCAMGSPDWKRWTPSKGAYPGFVCGMEGRHGGHHFLVYVDEDGLNIENTTRSVHEELPVNVVLDVIRAAQLEQRRRARAQGKSVEEVARLLDEEQISDLRRACIQAQPLGWGMVLHSHGLVDAVPRGADMTHCGTDFGRQVLAHIDAEARGRG